MESHGWAKTALNTAVLAATATGALPLPVAAAAVAVTAIPPVLRAGSALGERRLSVDLLDVAAIGISIGTGQPATGAFITWLLGVGDLVLEQTHDRARHAISKLMKLDASEAWRVGKDGQVERVAVKRLAVGDRIVVEAGGRVPADGVVLSGAAAVDEKALTGESIPKERRAGDRVLAATVVVDGQIVVEVDRVGGDTTAAKIVQILEGAGAKPMTLQRHAERVADRLVLPTFGVAGGAAMLASQIDRATSVLITDFGTGIRIAVPASALTAMTIAAREGVLVKGGQYLERLAKADVVVFDKTGTLTLGEPEVLEVRPFGKLAPDEIMALAAAAEERQKHPVAVAIRAYAEPRRGSRSPTRTLGSEDYTIGVGLRARASPGATCSSAASASWPRGACGSPTRRPRSTGTSARGCLRSTWPSTGRWRPSSATATRRGRRAPRSSARSRRTGGAKWSSSRATRASRSKPWGARSASIAPSASSSRRTRHTT